MRTKAAAQLSRFIISAPDPLLPVADGQIVMNAEPDPKESVTVARTLGMVFFTIMSLISVVVFLTDDRLDAFGCILIVAAPFGMGAIGYFVGLHNDPTSSD